MRQLKKFVLLLTTLFYYLSFLLPSLAFGQANDYEGHWAEAQITKWLTKELVGGYEAGSFKPNNNITRAEFMTMVNKAFGFTAEANITFKDVAANAWYRDQVAKAAHIGYVAGYEDGTIRPDNPISRQEAAVILAKIFNLDPSDASGLSLFTDASSIPAWSKGYVSAIAKEGYIGGYEDKTFRATKPITRAESVTVLDKAVGELYNEAGTYGEASEKTVIDRNVTISTPNVTLKNMEINGNLYITQGVGQGDVILEDVVVTGKTLIKGGGENSIIIRNSTLGDTVIDKSDGQVRIVALGDSRIGLVTINSGAKLEEDGVTGAGFGEVTIIEVAKDSVIEFNGNFQAINVEVTTNIKVAGGTVTELEIAKAAAGTTVEVATGARVESLTINAAVDVTGQGTISKAAINADGVIIEQKPTEIKVTQGVTAYIGNSKVSASSTIETTSSAGTKRRSKKTPPKLESIVITNPAVKTTYMVGEILDITGMVVTGTYSDGSTKVEKITIDNVIGFDSLAIKNSLILTVIVDGKLTTYSISVTADKTILINLIDVAHDNKITTKVSTDGLDILPSTKWVTQEQMATYSDTIKAAQLVMEKKEAAQEEVDAMVAVLETAITTFNKAKKDGMKTVVDVVTSAELEEALEVEGVHTINLIGSFSTDKKILISRPVALNGNNHTISFIDDRAGWQGNYLLHVYGTAGVRISNINLTGADGAILVDSSEVTLVGTIDVSENEFGGIQVSKASDAAGSPMFKATEATLTNNTEKYGEPTIWEDGVTGCVEATGLTKIIRGDQIQYYLKSANSKSNITTIKALDDSIVPAIDNEGQTIVVASGTIIRDLKNALASTDNSKQTHWVTDSTGIYLDVNIAVAKDYILHIQAEDNRTKVEYKISIN